MQNYFMGPSQCRVYIIRTEHHNSGPIMDSMPYTLLEFNAMQCLYMLSDDDLMILLNLFTISPKIELIKCFRKS